MGKPKYADEVLEILRKSGLPMTPTQIANEMNPIMREKHNWEFRGPSPKNRPKEILPVLSSHISSTLQYLVHSGSIERRILNANLCGIHPSNFKSSYRIID